MSIEAMKQWLEALELLVEERSSEAMDDGYAAITSLRQAIAEAEKQEPVAWICIGVNDTHDIDFDEDDVNALPVGTMLYTHPQPKVEQERFELIGHADLAINNIYIFNGYGEDVPEGRTPIYAKYQRQKASAPQESDDRIWPVELQGRLRDGEYSYDPEVEMSLFLKAVYWLENSPNTRDKAASKELRRLHEENIRLKECLFQMQEAAKQLATQPKREPLSHAALEQLLNSESQSGREWSIWTFARAIEAAHGINAANAAQE